MGADAEQFSGTGRTRLSDTLSRQGVPVLLLLSIVCYANAVGNGYVYDDRLLTVDHPALRGPFDLGRILTAPYWGTMETALLWRPITTLSFALGPLTGSTGAAWNHSVNVLLHAGIVLLWFLLMSRLFQDRAGSLVAAALFAVHPLHTEAVTWVAGRAELLAAGLGLTALLLFLLPNRWRWAAPIAVLLAVGSKESAAAIPLVLLLTAGTLRKGSMRVAWVSLLPVLLYMVVRAQVLGTWGGPSPDPADNPMSGVGLLARTPTVLDCAGRYVALTFWPAKLSADYSAPVLTLVKGLSAYGLLGLLATAGLLYLAICRRGRQEGWAAAFVLLTYALASNLIVVIGTIFAERLFYLPSAGVLFLLAHGGVRLARHRRSFLRPVVAVLALALLAGGIRTWARNTDWRDEPTLFLRGVETQPLSPKMQANASLMQSLAGNHEKALRHAAEAMRLDPTALNPRELYAASLESLGRGDDALEFLRTVLRHDPTDRSSRERAIRLLTVKSLRSEAREIAETGIRSDPANVRWYVEAAKQAQATGDYSAAIQYWDEAMRKEPRAIDVPLYLGYCLIQAGNVERAVEAYREGLRRDPSSAAAMNGYAWGLLETGGPAEEAVKHARMAVSRDSLPAYLETLCRAEMAAGNCAEALRAARAALQRAPQEAEYRQRLAEVESRCR